jgi:broad specificity phosphatase PhoE
MLLKKPFYFVRHGETDHNQKRLCAAGQTDIPLNRTGKSQARSLRQKINSLDITKLICSPLKRTIQTAKLATQHQMIIEQDIRECDLGDFEGKPVSDFIQYIEATPKNISFPNGESQRDFAKRVLAAVNKSLSAYGDNILFVSHGMVYWSLLDVMEIPFHYIQNAELIQFKFENKSWKSIKVQ